MNQHRDPHPSIVARYLLPYAGGVVLGLVMFFLSLAAAAAFTVIAHPT